MLAASLAALQTISKPTRSSPHWSSARQAPGPGRTSSGLKLDAALRADVPADLRPYPKSTAPFKADDVKSVTPLVADVATAEA